MCMAMDFILLHFQKYCKTDLNCFERHGAFADIATEYGKTSITDKNTLLSYYKNEVFPAVEQEGIVYFRTWHDFAMMVSKVRFFEGKESLLGCETPIYKISTTFLIKIRSML